MERLRLGVIFGSRTCEHEVSIISAVQLMKAIDRQSYDVVPIYISTRGEWFTGDPLLDIATYTPFDEQRKGISRVALDLTPGSGALLTMEHGKGLFGKEHQRVITRIDCAVPVMHGMHGEDGTLQGLLEMCNLPYTSSGVGASAIGMDKVFMKDFFRGGGFPVLPSCWFTRSRWENAPDEVVAQIEKELPYPVFVKPASLGSSIGVTRAKDEKSLRDALSLAFEFDRKVLVEKGVEHPLELNVSVLGYDDEAIPSEIEMPITGGDFLDFADKYLQGGSSVKGMASLKRIIPAKIEDDLRDKLQKIAVELFKYMDCKGVVRIDYMFDASDGNVYITEINTIPGSMAYYLWEPCGIPYSNLIDKMVTYAMKAQADKNNSNYAFTSDILKGVAIGGKAGSKLGSKNA